MEVLRRIIGSKKVWLTLIPSVFTVLSVEMAGLQPVVVLGVDALFAVLIVLQGALDLKNGSPSDGTISA